MIVVTGGAGFIGSAFVWKLNEQGIDDVLIVDDLGTSDKWRNLVPRRFADYLHLDAFRKQLLDGRFDHAGVSAIVHMGANSSTTERDAEHLMENNYRYTRDLAEWAAGRNVRFVYASSGATYGDGSLGFSDDDALVPDLRPLNMYGYSKQLFDLWALRTGMASRIAGLKFFNVFGPNEYHKGDMASLVYKAHGQIVDTGELKLFKSHHPDYGDGESLRDFVYVKDCVEVMWWLLANPEVNGIYNVGTGRARSWNDLAAAIFAAMGREPAVRYIDMPEALRGKYQYYTQASIEKLRGAGCPVAFRPLEDAVRDYVAGYLVPGERCL
jgi:ADP-L-glycero-D-manno-heptose 6-epimerase